MSAQESPLPAVADDVLSTLYPGLLSASVESGGRSLVALPNRQRARMLLPREPRLSSLALRRARHATSLRDRSVTRAARIALRAGLGRALGEAITVPRGPQTIDGFLSGVFRQEVVTATFLGPPRANRKPVIQVMEPSGKLLGMAKMGVSALSDSLVLAEARSLEALQSREFSRLLHPRLLSVHEWKSHPIVIQSPLQIWAQRSTSSPEARIAVAKEIAESSATFSANWWGSAHQQRVSAAIGQLANRSLRATLTAALELGIDQATVCDFGAWHGDFTPWNIAMTPQGQMMVWDWERYDDGVPLGFDLLHYALMPMLRGQDGTAATAAVRLCSEATEVLSGFERSVGVARQVAVAYLVELACRYCADGQHLTGAPGSDVAEWINPLVDRMRSGE